MNTTTESVTNWRGSQYDGEEFEPQEAEAVDQLQQMQDLQYAARVAMAWSPPDG